MEAPFLEFLERDRTGGGGEVVFKFDGDPELFAEQGDADTAGVIFQGRNRSVQQALLQHPFSHAHIRDPFQKSEVD